jgi:hypothetical protein
MSRLFRQIGTYLLLIITVIISTSIAVGCVRYLEDRHQPLDSTDREYLYSETLWGSISYCMEMGFLFSVPVILCIGSFVLLIAKIVRDA